jgi:hemerythrin
MDEEHEQCAAALTRALQRPADLQVLAAAHAVLQEHFGHEEELMRTAGFGGQVGGRMGGATCADA